MAVGEQVKEIFNKALELHAEFAVLKSTFERLERDVTRMDEYQRALHDRIGVLEAKFESVYEASMKDAIVQFLREKSESGDGVSLKALIASEKPMRDGAEKLDP